MNKVAMFYKVSFDQFLKDYADTFMHMDIEDISKGDISYIREIYDNIEMPKRATAGSAGYDFASPISFRLAPCETIKFPTGIRAEIESGWVLKIYPRSGLGFKYRMQLNNTVGIIDSDYFYSDNEGHIFVKITNDSKDGNDIIVKAGDSIVQGIFIPYGITHNDNTVGIRNGGFGSTGR